MADILKQFKKIKELVDDNGMLELSDEDALRYQDILILLEQRKYIYDFRVDGANLYRKTADFSGFEDWLKAKIKEEKKMSRREWYIAIVGAVVGAAVGLIPYIVTLLNAVG